MHKLTVAMTAAALLLAAISWTREPVPKPRPQPAEERSSQPAEQRVSRMIVGVGHAPYRAGQDADGGPHPSQNEINEDMPILRLMANTIRSYGLVNGGIGEKVLTAAQAKRFPLFLGLYLTADQDENDAEIAELQRLKDTYGLRSVEAIVVGNEVLLNQWLTTDELIARINQVRAIAPGIPVTTADTWYVLINEPNVEDVVDAVDFLFPVIIPYWDGVPIEAAVDDVIERIDALNAEYPGKPLIIAETGWPSGGDPHQAAQPSPDNQERFLREFLCRALGEGIEFFFHEAFDQEWKADVEPNGVGSHWGFFYSDRTPKSPPLVTLRRCPD